jgi:L-fuculose-phosphate aldolase
MHFQLLHPADQIIAMIERIYRYGMTTTSGGNLSIRDDAGDIWITPAGIDKGELTREDVVCVKQDGTIAGKHRPSSEFPFHQLIYRARPDLQAVVHAHPPALVSFSMVRKIPDTRLLPNERAICGDIGMAEYALPGSVQLGENIAKVFAEGKNTVMLENHGVVVGAGSLMEAFERFETLDFCARLEIKARRLGKPVLLSEEHYELVSRSQVKLETFIPVSFGTKERGVRRDMRKFVQRAYDQRLFTSTQGTFSQRIDEHSFIITPHGLDRKYIDVEDMVRIEHRKAEAGKRPSNSVELHQQIYERRPDINSILIAHPPNIMAFAVTEASFDSRTIPESYILLRDMPKLPFGSIYSQPDEVAERLSGRTPIVIVENDCVIVTGQSLLQAFDRLEVAEYSAKAILSALSLGAIVPIDDEKITELEIAFKLER